MTSLLPPNATKFELNLEVATQYISDIEVPISTLWNPWLCPIELLPWLAWSLSVDDWSPDWPEDVKRQTVADSILVHRKKGTVGAVKRAMAALGVDVDLVEWFEDGGEPGTFKVTAWANKNLNPADNVFLSEEFFNKLVRVIENTKPESRSFSMQLGVGFEQGFGVAGVFNSATVTNVNATATAAPTNAENAIGLAATLKAATVTNVEARAVPKPTNASASLGVVSTLCAGSVINLSANAAPTLVLGNNKIGLAATMRTATIHTINVRM